MVPSGQGMPLALAEACEEASKPLWAVCVSRPLHTYASTLGLLVLSRWPLMPVASWALVLSVGVCGACGSHGCLSLSCVTRVG